MATTASPSVREHAQMLFEMLRESSPANAPGPSGALCLSDEELAALSTAKPSAYGLCAETLCERLRVVRVRDNLRISDLGQQLNVEPQALGRMMRAECKRYQPDRVASVQRYLIEHDRNIVIAARSHFKKTAMTDDDVLEMLCTTHRRLVGRDLPLPESDRLLALCTDADEYDDGEGWTSKCPPLPSLAMLEREAFDWFRLELPLERRYYMDTLMLLNMPLVELHQIGVLSRPNPLLYPPPRVNKRGQERNNKRRDLLRAARQVNKPLDASNNPTSSNNENTNPVKQLAKKQEKKRKKKVTVKQQKQRKDSKKKRMKNKKKQKKSEQQEDDEEEEDDDDDDGEADGNSPQKQQQRKKKRRKVIMTPTRASLVNSLGQRSSSWSFDEPPVMMEVIEEQGQRVHTEHHLPALAPHPSSPAEAEAALIHAARSMQASFANAVRRDSHPLDVDINGGDDDDQEEEEEEESPMAGPQQSATNGDVPAVRVRVGDGTPAPPTPLASVSSSSSGDKPLFAWRGASTGSTQQH